MSADLQAQVLLLTLAEQEDLCDPASRRWLALCQQRAAEAALEEMSRPPAQRGKLP